jgi:hypothetical protein
MSNNSAAIGTMLKTFIASLRSADAEKELSKLGIKIKEVGADGKETFRDIQQVILDIAVATKYSEKDIQKVLLKISGGKFQWSKVAAMLSDYKEIVKNWELAINSQGFTEGQVMEQMDTVARKYQTLKDELTGLLVSAGNGGVQSAIKELLDRISTIIQFLNSLSSTSWTVITSVTEIAIAMYACNKAVDLAMVSWGRFTGEVIGAAATKAGVAATEIRGLSQAFRILGASGVASLTGIRVAMQGLLLRTGIGIVVVTISELIYRLMEYSNALDDVSTKSTQKAMDEYEAQTRLISIYQQRNEFIGAITTSYAALINASKDANLTDEKRKDLTKDIMEAEKQLTTYIGESGVERIRTADNVMEAAQNEANVAISENNSKIESMKATQQIIIETARTQVTKAAEAIKSYDEDKKAFRENIESKINDISWLASFETSYYKLKYHLQHRYNNALRNDIAEQEKRVKELAEQLKGTDDEFIARQYRVQADALDSLKASLAEGEKSEGEDVDSLFDSIFSEGYEKAQKIMTTWGSIWSKDSSNNNYPDGTQSSPSGGIEAYPEEPKKSKGSKSGNSYRHPEYNDPALTGYEGKHKSINQQYTDEISSLKKYAEKYGTSEEITMKIDDLYKKQQEENSRATKEYIDHIVQSGNDLYSSRLTSVTTQDVDSFINAIAGQESGGDYGAVNSSSGATGKYQIMPDNWAGWASEAGLSSDAPMTPNNQEIVARHKLSEYYNAYGADGAAVAWYAGAGNAERWVNGSPTDVWGRSWEASQDGAPSIAEYVREVASRNTGTVGYSQTLADLGVNEDDWKNANIQGKQTIISNLMKQDGIKDNEQTLKYLDEVNGTLLKGLEKIQALQQEAVTIQENKDKDLYSNSKAEVEQRKLEVSQRNTSQSYSLGLSIRDIDEQRMKLDELKVSYEALNDILPRFTKGTKTYKELLQETQKAQLEWNKQQKAVVESMFNIRSTMNEHEYKMKDMTGDNGGIRKATAELEKDMKDLANLQIKKQKEWYSLNKEEQWKLDEEIKEKADKVKEAMDKYHDTIMSGLESVAEQFFIDNKSLSDIFHDMWTDLGRDAWKMLFGQKVDNPSILGQMIGLGMPNQEEAKRDAATAMMSENNDALAMNTNGITSLNEAIERLIAVMNGTYHDPFSQPTTNWGSQTVGQSLDSFARFNNPSLSNEQRYSFDRFGATGSSYGVNRTRNSDYTFSMASIKSNEKTTAAMNNLSNTVRFSDTTTKQDIQAQLKNTNATKLNASNTMQLAVGLAGIGNAFANGDWLGGILGLAQAGIGLGWFGKANGGAFATGGSMSNGVQAAGRIQGAGTGRSDSILAYLANKGKFVMLSNGEYVINEKSAKALGYDTLDNLNAYADGGGLSSPVNPTPYVPTINQQVAKRAINIHSNNITTEKLLREQNAHMLEQNNLLKNMGQSGGDGKMIVLNTQASSADVLKALQENPRAVQAILGRQNRMGFR